MKATGDARQDAAEQTEADGPEPVDPAARARAYLDLWERHLVHAALRTRVSLGVRPRRR
ncbi:MAG: hypothetical protein U1E59_07575 [Amaricoccus sp.]